MKKEILFVFLGIFLGFSPLFATEKILLGSLGYFENYHSYGYEGGPTNGFPARNFEDFWQSWGMGSVQFFSAESSLGFYNSTLISFAEQISRREVSTNKYAVKEFRFTLNNIVGVGKNFDLERWGFLLSGGLHWDLAYFNKYPGTNDSRYFFLNLGLGLGGHTYFMLNERVNLHVGTQWWYDPFQVRSSSGNALSSSYGWDSGWGYNISLGVGFKLLP